MSAACLVAFAYFGPVLPAPLGLIVAIFGLIVALVLLVRYGLKMEDIEALGKPVRWLGRKIR